MACPRGPDELDPTATVWDGHATDRTVSPSRQAPKTLPVAQPMLSPKNQTPAGLCSSTQVRPTET